MYDTIRIRARVKDSFKLADIEGVGYVTGHTPPSGPTTTATFRNLWLHQKENTLTIHGSVTKAYFGNNYINPSRNEMKIAFEWLGKRLGIEIWNSEVGILEYGPNFFLAGPVEYVLSSLGSHPKMKSGSFESSWYYGSRKYFQLVFYDKGQESADLHACLKDQNLIRLETRIALDKMRRLFNRLTVRSLFEQETIDTLLGLMKAEYSQITEAPNWTLNPEAKALGPNSLGTKPLEDEIFFRGMVSFCPELATLPFREGYRALEAALNRACKEGHLENSIKSKYLKKIRERWPKTPLFVRCRAKEELDRAVEHFLF